MSPDGVNLSGYTNVFRVSPEGSLIGNTVDNTHGVRPVINLDKNVAISSGDGTSSNSYVVI